MAGKKKGRFTKNSSIPKVALLVAHTSLGPKKQKFLLMPMGVLASRPAYARPSTWSPIKMSRNQIKIIKT
jgi:hypothetical protein